MSSYKNNTTCPFVCGSESLRDCHIIWFYRNRVCWRWSAI